MYNGHEMIFSGNKWVSKEPPCITIYSYDWAQEKGMLPRREDIPRTHTFIDDATGESVSFLEATGRQLLNILGERTSNTTLQRDINTREFGTGLKQEPTPDNVKETVKGFIPLVIAGLGIGYLMLKK
jgi:hypothetical protein